MTKVTKVSTLSMGQSIVSVKLKIVHYCSRYGDDIIGVALVLSANDTPSGHPGTLLARDSASTSFPIIIKPPKGYMVHRF